MDYQPHYAQPFTLIEAIGLDVSVITEEIARLLNSLKHLRETQEMLRDYQSTEMPETADLEIQKALDENEVVIGSQTERISILRLALLEKGVVDSDHHAPNVPSSTNTVQTIHLDETPTVTTSQDNGRIVDYEGEGIHL